MGGGGMLTGNKSHSTASYLKMKEERRIEKEKERKRERERERERERNHPIKMAP